MIEKFELSSIYTASVAAQLWGIPYSTLKDDLNRYGKFDKHIKRGTAKKEGRVWLLTDVAMNDVYKNKGINKKIELESESHMLLESKLDFSKEELINLIQLPGFHRDVKSDAMELLMDLYHNDRDFNLYETVIKNFYSFSFHLGKTKLTLDGNKFPLTVKWMDLFMRYESQATSNIPVEHAKYLFAFCKEFLQVIISRIENHTFNGDYTLLARQLERLKGIVFKSTFKSDIDTLLTTAVRFVERSNPLLLEGSTTTQESKLSIETPFYKLNKSAFLGIVKEAERYNTEDLCKILEHAYYSYDESIFEGTPLSQLNVKLTALVQPSKKFNSLTISVGYEFRNKTLEEINQMSFKPFKATNIEEFYQEYSKKLEQLVQDEIIENYVKEYELFILLQNIYPYSKELSKEFLKLCIRHLEPLLLQTAAKNVTFLSDLTKHDITLTGLQAAFLNSQTFHGYDTDLQFRLVVENAKIVTVNKKEDNHSTIQMDEITFIEKSHQNYVEHIEKIKQSFGISTSGLNKVLKYYQSDIMEVQVDRVPLLLGKYNSTSKVCYLMLLAERRIENKVLTDEELIILVKEYYYKDVFSRLQQYLPLIDYYVEKGIKQGILDVRNEKDLSNIFSFEISDKLKFEILSNLYSEKANLLLQFVTKKENETPETWKERQYQSVIRFFERTLGFIYLNN